MQVLQNSGHCVMDFKGTERTAITLEEDLEEVLEEVLEERSVCVHVGFSRWRCYQDDNYLLPLILNKD